MPTMLEPVLRFSDVAFGIDATPKTLRNWLQRDQIDLFSVAPEGGGWRRFPMIDVALLALARHLVAFGFSVEHAGHLAHTMLIHMQGEKWLAYEPSTFISFWTNRAVFLTPNGKASDGRDSDPDGWDLSIRYMNDSRRPPAPAYLTIAPGRIMREAFERAQTGEEFVFPDELPIPGEIEFGPAVALGAEE